VEGDKIGVNNKIIINQAGEDRIVLEQLSNGIWKIKELNHTCKSIELGIQYLSSQRENVKQLLQDYNKEEK